MRKALPRERDLQAWVPSGETAAHTGTLLDDETFGSSANGGAQGANANGNGNANWDQFSANEQLFGVKASFDEDVYTTKLDRNAPDFKERERRAAKIASEIIGVRCYSPKFLNNC